MRLPWSLSFLPCVALIAWAGCAYEGPPDPQIEDSDPVGDRSAPTVRIEDDVALVATGDITFTFTFSEPVGDSFEAGDVQVRGGTGGAFESDGEVATLVVSVPDDSVGAVDVRVDVGAFEDLAGNANVVDAIGTRAYNTSAGVGGGTTLIDFEVEDIPDPVGFGAVFGEIVADPEEDANRVAQLTKVRAAEPWAGATLAYCPDDGVAVLPLGTGLTTISLRFWSPDAGVPVRLKVENRLDATESVEAEVVAESAGWQTLSFDFSSPVAGTTPLRADAIYDKLSVFPNFGTSGADAGEKLYYVDDVRFDGLSFDGSCPISFEEANLLADPGGEACGESLLPTEWLIFPPEHRNYGCVNRFGSFTPYQGVSSPGLRGQDTGSDNVTVLYQEFEREAGSRFTLAGQGLVYDGEPFSDASSTAYLSIKFFSKEFEYLGQVDSASLNNRTTAGQWTALTVSGTAPAGTQIVQAAMELHQCEGISESCPTRGVVMFDALRFIQEN